jgi:hypothetical protein
MRKKLFFILILILPIFGHSQKVVYRNNDNSDSRVISINYTEDTLIESLNYKRAILDIDNSPYNNLFFFIGQTSSCKYISILDDKYFIFDIGDIDSLKNNKRIRINKNLNLPFGNIIYNIRTKYIHDRVFYIVSYDTRPLDSSYKLISELIFDNQLNIIAIEYYNSKESKYYFDEKYLDNKMVMRKLGFKKN